MTNVVFFSGQNADGISDTFQSQGGKAVINVRANNYSGMQVLVEATSTNDPLSRWTTLPSGTITEDSSITLDYLPTGIVLRINATSVPGDAELFVDLMQ